MVTCPEKMSERKMHRRQACPKMTNTIRRRGNLTQACKSRLTHVRGLRIKTRAPPHTSGHVEKLAPFTVLVGMNIMQLLWKHVAVLQKNKQLAYGSRILLLRIAPKQTKIYIHTKLYTNVRSSIIHKQCGHNTDVHQLISG